MCGGWMIPYRFGGAPYLVIRYEGDIYFVHNGCFEGFVHHWTVILVMRRRQMREFRHGGS